MPTKPSRPAAASFIVAGAAVPGELYVNWSLHDVMVHTGRRRTLPQHRHEEVEFTSRHAGGEASPEWWVPAHYPLRVDAAEAARILAEHERLARVINGRAGGIKSSRARSVEVVDEETGEVTIVEGPRAVVKPRAAADPATGCQAGTSGHRVGLIVLRQRPRGFDRAKAIAAAMKELKMDKGLASSWVSTLLKRKEAFKAYALQAA